MSPIRLPAAQDPTLLHCGALPGDGQGWSGQGEDARVAANNDYHGRRTCIHTHTVGVRADDRPVCRSYAGKQGDILSNTLEPMELLSVSTGLSKKALKLSFYSLGIK